MCVNLFHSDIITLKQENDKVKNMNELPLELEYLILKYVRYVPLNKEEMKERLTDKYINLCDCN